MTKKNNKLDRLNALLDNLDSPDDGEVVSPPPKAVIEDNDVPPKALKIKKGKLGPTMNKSCGHFSWWKVEGKCGHYDCKRQTKKKD
jgi:hypothetical protein